MRMVLIAAVVLTSASAVQTQSASLPTAQAVLERYQEALGGAASIRQVQSETSRGEIERTGMSGKASFINYAKPFKSLFTATRPDGTQITTGFDGTVSWSMGPGGALIDRSTPREAIRRDADLQYALHQPDYFKSLEIVGVEEFEGRPCYHLHGITHWGKDNNQFYDVKTGLLAGYRYQADDASAQPVIAVHSDYKSFGAHLVPTRSVTRTAQSTTTVTRLSVSYEPIPDALFELPPAVKALLK